MSRPASIAQLSNLDPPSGYPFRGATDSANRHPSSHHSRKFSPPWDRRHPAGESPSPFGTKIPPALKAFVRPRPAERMLPPYPLRALRSPRDLMHLVLTPWNLEVWPLEFLFPPCFCSIPTRRDQYSVSSQAGAPLHLVNRLPWSRWIAFANRSQFPVGSKF